MKIDNPAARLYNFLKTTSSTDKRSFRTRRVLGQYLEKEGASDAFLYSQVSEIISLIDQTHILQRENFPGKNWTHWRDNIISAFAKLNLSADWGVVANGIDDRALTELEMLSTLFETKGQYALLDHSELEGFSETINELKKDVIAADLSAEMQITILHYLNKILGAIESYQITGIEPIMEAMESAVGRAMMNEDYRKALKDTGIGKKLGALIGVVANTVTVAQGIPFATLLLENIMQ